MANVTGPIIVDGVTLTAGAADVTSDTLIVSPHGGTVVVWLTNGATGPTVAAQVQPQVSVDGAKWGDHGGALVAGVVATIPYSWTVDIPDGINMARFVCGSNTDEDVTVTIHGQAVD